MTDRWRGQAHYKESRGKALILSKPDTAGQKLLPWLPASDDDSRQLSSLLCWEGKITVVLTYCTVTRLAGQCGAGAGIDAAASASRSTAASTQGQGEKEN